MFLGVGSSSKVRQILSSQQLEVEVKISNNDITTSRGLQVFTSLRIRGRAWWAPPGSPPKSAFNGADPKSIEAVLKSIEAVRKSIEAVRKSIEAVRKSIEAVPESIEAVPESIEAVPK